MSQYDAFMAIRSLQRMRDVVAPPASERPPAPPAAVAPTRAADARRPRWRPFARRRPAA